VRAHARMRVTPQHGRVGSPGPRHEESVWTVGHKGPQPMSWLPYPRDWMDGMDLLARTRILRTPPLQGVHFVHGVHLLRTGGQRGVGRCPPGPAALPALVSVGFLADGAARRPFCACSSLRLLLPSASLR
jgi:hypothetical protein